MFTLVLVRHGQAQHNVGKYPERCGIVDPQLTDYGTESCRLTNLVDVVSQLDDVAYFVSPLRRCLQTASICSPVGTKYTVVENLREHVGGKPCDFRLTKQELIEFVQADRFAETKQIQFDFTALPDGPDPWKQKDPHWEVGFEIVHRTAGLLRWLLDGWKKSPQQSPVLVSHSDLIACLLGLLQCGSRYRDRPDYRWLRNGEVRLVKIDPNFAERTVEWVFQEGRGQVPYPSIKEEAGLIKVPLVLKVENSANAFRIVEQEVDYTTVSKRPTRRLRTCPVTQVVSEGLLSLMMCVAPVKDASISIFGWCTADNPLPAPYDQALDDLVSHWRRDGQAGEILNAQGFIHWNEKRMPDVNLHLEEGSLYVHSHIVMVVFPSEEDGLRTCSSLKDPEVFPVYVTSDLEERVLKSAISMGVLTDALSITVIYIRCP